MTTEEVIREVAKAIADEADVRAVFGDPLKLEGQAIIPVATIRIHFSGGIGGMGRMLGRGGGANLDVKAKPVGFICEEGGKAVFRPIEIKGDECQCQCQCKQPGPAPRKAKRKAGERVG